MKDDDLLRRLIEQIKRAPGGTPLCVVPTETMLRDLANDCGLFVHRYKAGKHLDEKTYSLSKRKWRDYVCGPDTLAEMVHFVLRLRVGLVKWLPPTQANTKTPNFRSIDDE